MLDKSSSKFLCANWALTYYKLKVKKYSYSELYIVSEDLLPACDTGLDPSSSGRPSYLVIFLYHLENGLVQITTRGSPSRYAS